jgi:putative membrane protein
VNRYAISWALIFVTVTVASAINPHDGYTWFLESLPALLGAGLLWYFRSSWPLTPLLYVLILIHCVVLLVGAHYTYALVPYFDQFMTFIWEGRNNYDKLGHFVQGFVPAMICREIVVRHGIITHVGWRRFFIISFCLGFSAFYELIEWWVALLSDEAAESFLGTQGYVWDTQSDMFLALIGSVVALFTLSHWHDQQIQQLNHRSQQ